MNITKLQQVVIEDHYSRHNQRSYVKRAIKEHSNTKYTEAINLVTLYKECAYHLSKAKRINHVFSKITSEDIVLEILTIVLPIEGTTTIQSVVGALAPLLKFDDIFDGIRTASELVAVVCFSDLYDIIPARNSETGSMLVKSNYQLDEYTLKLLRDLKYLPPMICEPNFKTNNSTSGYLTKENDSVILGKTNHHEENLNLKALNIVAKIPLELDLPTLDEVEESKKSMKSREDDETYEAFIKRRDQHILMVESSKVVYQELLDLGNKFYLDYKYDSRGRQYSQGYHVNIQSTEYKKALINLSNKHLITGV